MLIGTLRFTLSEGDKLIGRLLELRLGCEVSVSLIQLVSLDIVKISDGWGHRPHLRVLGSAHSKRLSLTCVAQRSNRCTIKPCYRFLEGIT